MANPWARIRLQYPMWSFRKEQIDTGTGFVTVYEAVREGYDRITSTSLLEFGLKIEEAEREHR